MKRKIFTASRWGTILLFASICAFSQTIETIGGVRTVHNVKGGKLGDKPGVSIQLIRKIGDIDTLDENLAFYFPSDIAMDAPGNIYVLDSANHRVQKFSPEGTYLATFGRRGQGPGEFYNPDSFDIDAHGFFYVMDAYQNRIQTLTPAGAGDKTIGLIDASLQKLRCLKSGFLAVKSSLLPYSFMDKAAPPKLIKVLDREGKLLRSFVDAVDYGDGIKSVLANAFEYAVDGNDNFYLAYAFQNKVEKYNADGKLLWRADWPLNFIPGSWGADFAAAEMNICSAGIAVDIKRRIWVVTLEKPLRKEEKVEKSTFGFKSRTSGATTISRVTKGNTDLRTCDSYKLEIFDTDGILQGGIRLTHFVDGIRIIGDNLFLLDEVRGVTFYQYKIIEK
jgi:hypothetical protein